jgi:hypothetical protein
MFSRVLFRMFTQFLYQADITRNGPEYEIEIDTPRPSSFSTNQVDLVCRFLAFMPFISTELFEFVSHGTVGLPERGECIDWERVLWRLAY